MVAIPRSRTMSRSPAEGPDTPEQQALRIAQELETLAAALPHWPRSHTDGLRSTATFLRLKAEAGALNRNGHVGAG